MATELKERIDTRESADGSWMLWTVVALAAVWAGVTLISVFAPDLVTGVFQERLPLAAFTAWIWGLAATVAVFMPMNRLRGSAHRKQIWIGFAATVIVIWTIASLLGIFLPVFETGTDPTRLPLGAIFAPLAAAALTALAGFIAVEFGKGARR